MRIVRAFSASEWILFSVFHELDQRVWAVVQFGPKCGGASVLASRKPKESPDPRLAGSLAPPNCTTTRVCDKRRQRVRTIPTGFTIIEVMVAIFIFALLFAAIYSSWMAVMRASRSGLEVAAAVQRSRVAVATVEEALNCSRAFGSAAQYYSFVAENGSDAYLSFVAKLPQSFPRSGRFGSFDVRRVTFSLEPGPDSGRQLVLRQNPMLMEPDIDEKEHPIVLAKDVKDFELAFWDPRSGDWLDEWTQTNELPTMVLFTLRWGGNSPQANRLRQEITRVVALPTTVVPSSWQMPGAVPQRLGSPPPPPPPGS